MADDLDIVAEEMDFPSKAMLRGGVKGREVRKYSSHFPIISGIFPLKASEKLIGLSGSIFYPSLLSEPRIPGRFL